MEFRKQYKRVDSTEDIGREDSSGMGGPSLGQDKPTGVGQAGGRGGRDGDREYPGTGYREGGIQSLRHLLGGLLLHRVQSVRGRQVRPAQHFPALCRQACHLQQQRDFPHQLQRHCRHHHFSGKLHCMEPHHRQKTKDFQS